MDKAYRHTKSVLTGPIAEVGGVHEDILNCVCKSHCTSKDTEPVFDFIRFKWRLESYSIALRLNGITSAKTEDHHKENEVLGKALKKAEALMTMILAEEKIPGGYMLMEYELVRTAKIQKSEKARLASRINFYTRYLKKYEQFWDCKGTGQLLKDMAQQNFN